MSLESLTQHIAYSVPCRSEILAHADRILALSNPAIFMISLYGPYASFIPFMLDCTELHNNMIFIMGLVY